MEIVTDSIVVDAYTFVHSPWFWLVLTIAFIVIELITSLSLTTIWFAISAFFMIFLSNLLFFRWQMTIFIIVSAILLIFTRPIIKKKIGDSKSKTNVDALVGKSALVVKKIAGFQRGEVKLGGIVWAAQSESGVEIADGAWCIISAVEGAHLIVREADKHEAIPNVTV